MTSSLPAAGLPAADATGRPDDPGRDRLAGVDVLRGLCILSVLLHHAHLRFTTTHKYAVDHVLPPLLNQVLFWSGLYAVIAFFVISGFLITGGSVRRWGSLPAVDAARFYRMRMARILPCLFLLLVVLSTLHFLDVPGARMYEHRAGLARSLVAALTFHMNWIDGHYGWSPPAWGILWSLSIEEVFYVAFPVACLLLRREKAFAASLLILVIAGPVNRTMFADDQPWGAYAYLSGMDGMAFGCLAALLTARVSFPDHLLRASLVAGAALALLIVLLCPEDDHHSGIARYGLNVTLLEIGVALMLVPLGRGIGNRTLSTGTSWLRAMGRCSYEIYLFHMLPLIGLMAWFELRERSAATIAATYAAMLATSLALGFLLWRWFSEPLNRRLRG